MKWTKGASFSATEKVDVYEHGDYIVAVWHDEKNVEAYLTGKDCGDLELMSEASMDLQTLDEILELIEGNLDTYIEYFEAKSYKEGRRWQATKAD